MTNIELITNARMVNKNGQTFYEYPDGGSFKHLNEKGEETEFNDSPPEVSSEEAKSRVETMLANVESEDPVAMIKSNIKKYIYLENEGEYLLLALIPLLSYVVTLFDRIPYFWFSIS